MAKKIIFATKNQHKMIEIKEILKDLPVEIISMEEAGYTTDVIEDGKTFEENALKKAVQIMEECGQIVLADDSGLEIDFLNKEPGIYSARYLGKDTPYSKKNSIILERLENVPDDERTARFVCAIAAAIPGREPIVLRETFEGRIADKITGENGFGYDPIFYYPPKNKTAASMTSQEKNKLSHRGKALRKMREELLDKIFNEA